LSAYIGKIDSLSFCLRFFSFQKILSRFHYPKRCKRSALTFSLSFMLKEQTDVVKLLLKKGANVDAVDLDENTPFHCACFRARQEIVHILTATGANIHRRMDLLFLFVNSTSFLFLFSRQTSPSQFVPYNQIKTKQRKSSWHHSAPFCCFFGKQIHCRVSPSIRRAN
jgi:hypothetical protein